MILPTVPMNRHNVWTRTLDLASCGSMIHVYLMIRATSTHDTTARSVNVDHSRERYDVIILIRWYVGVMRL